MHEIEQGIQGFHIKRRKGKKEGQGKEGANLFLKRSLGRRFRIAN
jgi:hypothetical protein